MSFSIPDITDAQLEALYDLTKPLVKDGKDLYYIRKPDLRNVAFPWDPKLTWKATGLHKVRTIRTLHEYGYYGMFKPSVAEVLAQIPKSLIGRVQAFYVEGPKTAAELNMHKDELNAGFHVAETTFYSSKKKPWWKFW